MESIKRKSSDKVVALNVANSTAHTEPEMEFRGYTLDEIRHHRALLAVKKEFAKAKMLEHVDGVKERNPFAPDGTLKAASRLGSIPMKLVKGLNYTDYIMLGFTAFSTARKLFSFFKRKKK